MRWPLLFMMSVFGFALAFVLSCCLLRNGMSINLCCAWYPMRWPLFFLWCMIRLSFSFTFIVVQGT